MWNEIKSKIEKLGTRTEKIIEFLKDKTIADAVVNSRLPASTVLALIKRSTSINPPVPMTDSWFAAGLKPIQGKRVEYLKDGNSIFSFPLCAALLTVRLWFPGEEEKKKPKKKAAPKVRRECRLFERAVL